MCHMLLTITMLHQKINYDLVIFIGDNDDDDSDDNYDNDNNYDDADYQDGR